MKNSISYVKSLLCSPRSPAIVAEMSDDVAPEEAAVPELPASPVPVPRQPRVSVALQDNVSGSPDVAKMVIQAAKCEYAPDDQVLLTNRPVFYKEAGDLLMAPADYAEALQSGRLAYLKRCSELNLAPCSKFVKQLVGTTADLTKKGLGPDGTEAVAACLKVNTTLTAVSLGDNFMGEQGAASLTAALAVNKTIVVLDISSNLISPPWMARLLPVCRGLPSMTDLCLRQNSFDDACTKTLCQAVIEGWRLKRLDLSHNAITHVGVRFHVFF